MQILTVTYGRTINLGNFESARLDATAQVEPSETPEEALAKLKEWMETRVRIERADNKPVAPSRPTAEGWR